ncbi:MAG TPA: hypothetical protein VE553_05960 [Candidatus Binatia bacterium]|nr:hypothetical protein [Candidatus Binatia bacterium]
MDPLTHHLNARHLARGETHALLLDNSAPLQPLRLALIVRGSERHVFPSLALDDWGRERKGVRLYRWLYEEGPRFPRAEVFGFDDAGVQTQIFLRDLELSFHYPCYLYGDDADPVQEGLRVDVIFVPGPSEEAVKIDAPDSLPWAMRRAAVRWRAVEPQALADAGWRDHGVFT